MLPGGHGTGSPNGGQLPPTARLQQAWASGNLPSCEAVTRGCGGCGEVGVGDQVLQGHRHDDEVEAKVDGHQSLPAKGLTTA